MIEAALNVHEKAKLKCCIDDSAEKTVLNIFKEAPDKALSGTYTDLYKMTEKSIAKLICIGAADDLVNTMIGKLA